MLTRRRGTDSALCPGVRSFLPILALSFVGCSAAESHVCTGPTGFASDRAREISFHVEGDATVAVTNDALTVAREAGARTMLELAARGVDVAPEHALVAPRVLSSAFTAGGRQSVHYALEVTSFVRTAPTRMDVANELLDASPPWASLGDERTLRVGAAFGQMSDGVLADGDEGLWSATSLADELTARGFTREGRFHRRGRLEVEIVAPELAPIFDDVTRERTSRLIAESDVVYVNGHAETRIMEALSLASSWSPRKPRLVVLDSCWSYYLESRRVQAISGPTHLVVTDGRAITGSVASFVPIVDALLDPSRAPTWRSLLTPMNDRAAERAVARKGKVKAEFEPAEVYGVVPPRP